MLLRYRFVAAAAVLLALVCACPAWWVKGHETITEAAASRLPDAMPAFFRAAGKHLGHLAGDPDRWKNPDARHLRAAESADHFIDIEDYDDNELPPDRYQAIALLQKLRRRPDRAGMLPYAIMEDYDRLSCAFYDLRADPNNEAIHMKCIVYAGNLAHFSTDAVMPLHTTRDYDGRKGSDGKFQQKGIHARIDGFPEKNGLTAEEISRGLEPKAVDDMWSYVLKRIHESHRHIDRCYQLDLAGAIEKPTAESRAFILDRCREGAQFSMDLWYNAWLRSGKMRPHY